MRDVRGFVVTDANFETAAPGVFAAGAVRSGYGGRLTQAVAEATTAAERSGGALRGLGRVLINTDR